MKGVAATRIFGCAAVASALLLVASATPVLAAEGGGWRPIYDVVMLWVNFGILVLVLFKLLKRPLRDFFRDRKEEVALEIQRIEEEKARAQQRVAEATAELEDSQARLERVRQRIVAEGERVRDSIIEDARDHSRVLITQARRRIDNQLLSARRQFKAELVETAIEIAMDRLPKEVTEADNQRYIDLYLKTAV
jgi:F-type H+-transporting ATPase subunit b